MGTDPMQASLALLAMAEPDQSVRILALAASASPHHPYARFLTPIEQSLSAAQRNNENKDAVRTLAALLAGDAPCVTLPKPSAGGVTC